MHKTDKNIINMVQYFFNNCFSFKTIKLNGKPFICMNPHVERLKLDELIKNNF